MRSPRPLRIVIGLFAGAILAGGGVRAAADDASAPKALVAALYKLPDDASPFFTCKNRKALDKYFTKALADLIWKDNRASKGEVGAIDGSPIYDAQDYEPKNLTVHPAKIDRDRAFVLVTFTNYGKSKRIAYTLEQNTAGQWRIADIRWAPDRTLLGILRATYPE
jgi:hypothetical protein